MSPLSQREVDRFAREGYLVVPGVVSETLMEGADREIAHLMANVGPDDGDGGPGPTMWFVPPETIPGCVALLDSSGARELADQLVAPMALTHSSPHVQVATTVPPFSHVPGGPHIDGHGPGQDPPHSFTLLVGIVLSDQTRPQSGNLWVWPGSHHVHRSLFAERGPKALTPTGGHATLLDPPPELGPPVEVKGRRGDVLLAHFLLGHNKGGNTTPAIRRTVYFRLAVPGHAGRWASTFLDPWVEYPPVRDLARRSHRRGEPG